MFAFIFGEFSRLPSQGRCTKSATFWEVSLSSRFLHLPLLDRIRLKMSLTMANSSNSLVLYQVGLFRSDCKDIDFLDRSSFVFSSKTEEWFPTPIVMRVNHHQYLTGWQNKSRVNDLPIDGCQNRKFLTWCSRCFFEPTMIPFLEGCDVNMQPNFIGFDWYDILDISLIVSSNVPNLQNWSKLHTTWPVFLGQSHYYEKKNLQVQRTCFHHQKLISKGWAWLDNKMKLNLDKEYKDKMIKDKKINLVLNRRKPKSLSQRKL